MLKRLSKEVSSNIMEYSQLLDALEQASQKHEKEIVIELGSDRILHFVGVYLVLVLAALSKFSQLADDNATCYPIINETGHGSALIKHVTNHCWESSTTLQQGLNQTRDTVINSTLGNASEGYKRVILENPSSAKSIIQLMPYAMILEAFLFAIPSSWWHFMVGARLMGHLNFMKLLLNEIYESLKIIPAGIYRKKPYDQEGVYLNGWRSYKPEYKKEKQQGLSDDDDKNQWEPRLVEGRTTKIYGKNAALTIEKVAEVTANAVFTEDESESEGPSGKKKKNESKQCTGGPSAETQTNTGTGTLERFLFGEDMLDKHIFSMLCYENFASMEHHPYIMSVYQLTSTGAASGDRRGVFPMKQGILRQFCHEKNFNSRYLVKCYIIQQLFRMISSFALLVVIWSLFGIVMVETFGTKTFRCDIPFHDLRFVCTLVRHWDFSAIYLTNSAIVLVYFGLSSFQYYFVRWGSDRALCYYFKDMMDSFSVALLAAHKASR